MITQAQFDKIVTHSRQMKRRSGSAGGACAYHNADGNMCFIGVLIPDEIYRNDMEGLTMQELYHADDKPWCAKLMSALNVESIGDAFSLSDLQEIHDRHFYSREAKLRKWAKDHNLVMPPLGV